MPSPHFLASTSDPLRTMPKGYVDGCTCIFAVKALHFECHRETMEAGGHMLSFKKARLRQIMRPSRLLFFILLSAK